MSKKLASAFAILLSLIPIAVIFQNCSGQFKAGETAEYRTEASRAPELQFTTLPAMVSNTRAGEIQFNLALNKHAKIKSVTCIFNEGADQDCSSGTYQYLVTQDRDNTLVVRAVDSFNNNAAELLFQWRIDATEPTLVINSGPAAISGSRAAAFVFTAADNLSGVQRIECSLDGAAFQACTSPLNLANLTEAPHSMRMRSLDFAGNLSALQTFNWTIDTTAPIITFDRTPLALTNQTTAVFEFSGTDMNLPITTFECSLDGAVFAACTSPANLTGLINGTHAFQVRGVDAAQNRSAALTFNWQVDLLPPVITFTAPIGEELTSNSVTFVFTITDNSNVIAASTCAFDNVAVNCTSPQTFSNLQLGPHVFTASVRDGAGNVQNAQRAVTVRGTLNDLGLSAQFSNYTAVTIDGDYLYAVRSKTVDIFSIANPASPVRVGSYTTPSEAIGHLRVSGNVMVLVGRPTEVISLASRATPVRTAILPNANDGDLQNNLLVISPTITEALAIYDVSNLTNPTLRTQFAMPPRNLRDPYIPRLNGRYAYALGSGRVVNGNVTTDRVSLFTLDLINPAAPVILNENTYDGRVTSNQFIFASNHLFFPISNTPNRLVGLNAVNPTALADIGVLPYGLPRAAASSMLFLASTMFIDLTTRQMAFSNTNQVGSTQNVAYHPSGYLYAAEAGLEVLRVNTTTRLIEQSVYVSDTAIYYARETLASRGNILYLNEYRNSLRVRMLDMTNPQNPQILPTVVTGAVTSRFASGRYHLFVKGNYLFRTTDYRSFDVFDISNPSNPQFAGPIDEPYYSYGPMFVIGSQIFMQIADPTVRLFVFTPQAGGTFQRVDTGFTLITKGNFTAAEVVVHGNRVWSAGNTGVHVYDLTNPMAPVLLNSFFPNLNIFKMAVDGNSVVIASTTGNTALPARIDYLDANNTNQATVVRGFDAPLLPLKIDPSGNALWLSDRSNLLGYTIIGNGFVTTTQHQDFSISDFYDACRFGNYFVVAENSALRFYQKP